MQSSKQQEVVLQKLAEADGPMTAKELWASLDRTGIGLATVYRALRRGVEDDRLVAVEVTKGTTRYEPRGRGHHHHFYCSICDRAFDLEGCVKGLESLLPENFAMTKHEVVLFGTCDTCGDAR